MTTHPADWSAHSGAGRHWLAAAADLAFAADGHAGGPNGFAACALSAEPHVTHAARDFTASTLTGWGLGDVADDAVVVVSELLSNALRYGVTGPLGRALSPHPVWLGLLRRGEAVLVAVSDPGSDVPEVREADFFAETGRGLHVIDELSLSWGWTPPDEAGKAVWAVLVPC
jgi:anti-sigma regulatory factor (Ser/Thr protein kinase)